MTSRINYPAFEICLVRRAWTKKVKNAASKVSTKRTYASAKMPDPTNNAIAAHSGLGAEIAARAPAQSTGPPITRSTNELNARTIGGELSLKLVFIAGLSVGCGW